MLIRRKNRFTAALLTLAIAWPGIALAACPSANRAYLGKPVDPAFGFQDLQNRWYDPATGRFLSIDPVFWEVGRGTPDSKRALLNSQLQNPTSYSVGNPIRYSDPQGRQYDTVADIHTLSEEYDRMGQGSRAERTVNEIIFGADLALALLPLLPAVAGAAVRDVRAALRSVAADVAEWRAALRTAEEGGRTAEVTVKSAQGARVSGQMVANALKPFSGRTREAVERLLDGAAPGKVSSSRQFHKAGALEKATNDFKTMVGDAPVENPKSGTWTATLGDGSQVTLYARSSGGPPTVSVMPPQRSGREIKVRYGTN